MNPRCLRFATGHEVDGKMTYIDMPTILLMEEIRRSPVGMVNIPLFTGFHTCQVFVWDFSHQQYVPEKELCSTYDN